MTEKIKNILIGLFVLSAAMIIITMILFFEPKIGDGEKTFHVRFANIAGIVVGTRVAFAGKPVGEVTHIKEIYNAREYPDQSGRVFFYELTLRTDSGVKIYNTDEIAIRSVGFMGEKSVAILPKGGLGSTLITDEVIYANAQDPIEHTFNQATQMVSRIEKTALNISSWFDQNQVLLSDAIQNINQAASSMHDIFLASENKKIIPLLYESATLVNDNLRCLRTSLVDDQLLCKVASLTECLEKTAHLLSVDGIPALRNVSQIAENLSSGTGTVGRLIARDDLYLNMNALFSKADTLMNDINHYGILFQYDKKWKKNRTKKANLLKSLDSPKEFRAYFADEVDAITVSLARLSELLERLEDLDAKDTITENESFRKQFAVLLRNAQSLTESIKLYNENLCSNTLNN